jgi:flagellar M-ring protein FliF
MLEMRQQMERALVAKISSTLEPLLGQTGFRTAASVDYDPTSGEQQEETLDPTKSVMVSSQKTEDSTERASASAGGIPGTASNLPAPPPRPASGTTGTAHRTENVSYQTSRIVRHTRIPQGAIRRMSLAVLVGQTVRWEGKGAARVRILVPPTPETMKTIKDLIAGVTGLNTDRGDQLIVETLPFESALNAEPPVIPQSVSRPGVQGNNLQDLFTKKALPLGVGFGVLVAIIAVFLVFAWRRGKIKDLVAVTDTVDVNSEAPMLPAPEALPPHAQIAGATVDSPTLSASDGADLVDRVIQSANRDLSGTTTILRAWLREREPSGTGA